LARFAAPSAVGGGLLGVMRVEAKPSAIPMYIVVADGTRSDFSCLLKTNTEGKENERVSSAQVEAHLTDKGEECPPT